MKQIISNQNCTFVFSNGKALAKQFREYHTQIGHKCHQLQGKTDRYITMSYTIDTINYKIL